MCCCSEIYWELKEYERACIADAGAYRFHSNKTIPDTSILLHLWIFIVSEWGK
jgi:hypothetical protein